MSDEPKDDGGQAFPVTYKTFDDDLGGMAQVVIQGMSLRDWMAGMALQGILAAHETALPTGDVAEEAYEYADAMLAERGKR